METPLLSLLAAALLMWLFTALGLWIWALRRVALGRPVLEPEPRADYPGGLAEVLICAGAYMLVGAALAPRILPDAPADVPLDAAAQSARMIPMIVLNSVATLSGVAAALAWMGWQGLSPRQLGLIPRGIDFVIGGVAAIMLLPLVFAMQGILTSLVEYHHPLLEVLQRPQPVAVLAAMAISSTLIAPLAEEFFFRGLLQGWLGGIAGAGQELSPNSPESEESPESQQPYEPSRVEHLPQPPLRPWWPAVVTSLLFAVVHLGQGPAPITLFFLALGLGYLYRQTGRIWAPIVVHMALNGLTTAATILTTTAGVGQ